MKAPNARTRWFAFFAVATALVAGVVAAVPAAASAAPTEPIMTLATLQSRLATSSDGTVSGYLKTVLQGTTITTIPVTVVDVASAGSAGLDGTGSGSYIVFIATGPVITRLGAIAEGMSGSPLYIPDGGQDKLIGALSYGDYFSTDGSGLATPIEAMMGLESAYPLFSPMSASAASAGKGPVTVKLHAAAAKRLGESSFTAKPLAAIEIGGLPSSAPGVVAVRKALAAKGVTVLAGSPMSSAGVPSNVATLEGGASVVALAARGDVWYGGLGTITYATPSTVVAFGHPLLWDGPSDLYMTNAWIDYTMPNGEAPYKMGAPTAVRGTVEQDRGVGIMGAIGRVPAESTITASATDIDSGHTASSATYLPTSILSAESSDFAEIPYLAAYGAGFNAEDRYDVFGSALTTTTVVVRDGTQTYTVVRSDLWDSGADSFMMYGNDLVSSIPGDASMMVGDLQNLGTNGLAHPQILSVDVKSSISSARASAQIADFTLTSPLKIGPNHIKVLENVWGNPDTQTVDATLTLPPGTSLNGDVVVWGGGTGDQFGYGSDGLTIISDSGSSSGPAQTTAQGIDALNKTPRNSDLVVDYTTATQTINSSLPGSDNAIESRTSTAWYQSGEVDKTTSKVFLDPMILSLPYGGGTDISGDVESPGQFPGMVAIYGQQAGSSVVTTLDVVPLDDEALFDTHIDGLTKNTLVTVAYLGDSETLPSQATRQLYVSAAVGLKASASSVKHGARVTLRATLLPLDTTGSVIFEYLSGRTWKTIGSGTIAAAKASFSWKVPKGKFTVRARYSGSINHGGTSKAITVTGK